MLTRNEYIILGLLDIKYFNDKKIKTMLYKSIRELAIKDTRDATQELLS